MNKADNLEIRVLVAAAAILTAIYLIGTSSPAIFGETEGQYSGAAREMLERNDWLVPTNNGIPRLQKPPLVYYTQMLSYKVFGLTEFAARLPNTLFCMGWFVVTGLLAAQVFGRATGLRSAVILASMMGTFILGNLIMPEPFLAFFMSATFLCFVLALKIPAQAGRWMLLAWICMALGVFAKGLHGMLYPVLAAALCAWRIPETRQVWKKLLHPFGITLFLLITVPWYVAIELKFPGFLADHFINEQVGHTINTRYPPDSDRVPFLIFWVQHLVFFFPWSLFIPAAWIAWRRRERDPGNAGSCRFLLAAWVGINVVTILPSALQDYYTLLIWGVVAMWLANALREAEKAPAWSWIVPGGLLAVIGVLLVAGGGIVGRAEAATGTATLAERDNIWNTVTGFSPEVWASMSPLAVIAGVVFLVSGIATIGLVIRGRHTWILPMQAVAMVAIFACASRGMSAVEGYFSHKWAVLEMDAMDGTHSFALICEGDARINTSLLFYTNRRIYWLGSDPREEFASRKHGIGAEHYMNKDELLENWPSAEGLFLLIEEEGLEEWLELLSHGDVVGSRGTRVLLSNRSSPDN